MLDYTLNDIKEALWCVGVMEGDDVFMHTNLGFFGRGEGVNSSDDLCAIFFKAVKDVIGKSGTILVPTFTYSSCHGEDFDPNITPCKMGLFSDYILKQPEAIRSLDPNFSVAAIGARAVYYTQNPPEKSFGDNCFFERFYLQNGIICNFNFDAGSTYVHYVEHKLNVPYRYDKQFKGRVKVYGKWEERCSYHFVFDKPENAPVFNRLHKLSVENGIAKVKKLGRGVVLGERAQDLFFFIEKTMKERPRFLLKEE